MTRRDLKPGNIMITKPDAAVLADQPLVAGRRRNLTKISRLPAQYIQPIQHPLLIERHLYRPKTD
jgi:serine/threonine protein kinase